MISIIPRVGYWAVPLLQALFVLATAIAAELNWEGNLKWPILFGGGISVVNLLWLRWRLRRSERRQPMDDENERDTIEGVRAIVADLYLTVIERFVIVISLFLLGMVKLDLEPLGMIVGFVAGQLMLMVGGGQLSQHLTQHQDIE